LVKFVDAQSFLKAMYYRKLNEFIQEFTCGLTFSVIHDLRI